MDILGNLTNGAFDALAAHPTLSTIGISATMLTAAAAAWHMSNPDRVRTTAPATTTATHRRSTTGMSLLTRDNGPQPGTYVSITEPPMNEHGLNAYQQLGSGAIRAATDQFYNSVQTDSRLAPFFPMDKMDHLKRHLPLLIGQLLGGPVHYENPVQILRDSHQPLGISPTAYSFLCAHLNTILYGLKVPHDIRIFLTAQLIKVEDLIISEALQPA